MLLLDIYIRDIYLYILKNIDVQFKDLKLQLFLHAVYIFWPESAV